MNRRAFLQRTVAGVSLATGAGTLSRFASFECGIEKGQKAEEGIPAAFRMLEKQWAEATV